MPKTCELHTQIQQTSFPVFSLDSASQQNLYDKDVLVQKDGLQSQEMPLADTIILHSNNNPILLSQMKSEVLQALIFCSPQPMKCKK